MNPCLWYMQGPPGVWLQTSLLHCVPKKSFQQYYSYILQIIYVFWEENKLLPPYTSHMKNVTTLPCKMHNFFIWLKVCCIPPNVGGSEKSRLWVGIGGSEKNRLWYVANGMSGSNVTANVQSDHLLHGYMLPVFFATDQLHRPPRCAKIQPMSQQDASATCPYRGLLVLDTREKMKKMKNLCILQGSAVTFFRSGG